MLVLIASGGHWFYADTACQRTINMCGFIVCDHDEAPKGQFVSRRGPDSSGCYRQDRFGFYHYLLHITGARLVQPIVHDGVVCMFNGEIYSEDYLISDGELILPLYQRFGDEFASHIDGEFAIAIYDFKRERIILATDAFGTKPLWAHGPFCASYASAVGGSPIAPNQTLIMDLRGNIISKFDNYSFDFSHQDESTFCGWIRSFKHAVAKRAKPGCYVGLSSGYDSGAIACELQRTNIEFRAFSIVGAEHSETLLARSKMVRGDLLSLDKDAYAAEQTFLRQNCEPYNYHRHGGIRLRFSDMHDDPGAIGASFVHRYARSQGCRVYLSGQGADEIIADYSKTPSLSHFKGVFPKALYPWPNFADGCQRAYLAKEELVAGTHGIEGRYPFLDRELVQQFLWLRPELKNQAYKAPLLHYLKEEGFPLWEDHKVGFQVFPSA